MTLSNLTFSDAPVPVRTRGDHEPNPFDGVVGGLAIDGPAQTFVIEGPADEKTNEDLRNAIRLLRDAGKTHDVTTRSKFAPEGKNGVRITFWVVKRITRPRAEEAAPAESAAE